ncbi:hypothetical protein ABE096_14320 [Robertmurraya massiliosenegalensis]|uniref:hypothetical protein n=1 Tax=Robertmurraya massiliosenegalensis TaxID=1287657 RepID=UPI003D2B75F5
MANRRKRMNEHLCENDSHTYHYNLFAEQAGFFLEMENKGWRRDVFSKIEIICEVQ